MKRRRRESCPACRNFFPELALNNIAVAAVDGVRPPAVTVVDGEELRQPKIAGFSSRCGGASFCISAPGVANYVYSRQEVRDEAVRLGCATPDDVQRCPGAIFKIFNDIIAGRYHTGEGSGFVLAPESARYDSRESYLPPGAGFDIASGTSFAAPLVSGSLALMRQYFMRATGCAGGGLRIGRPRVDAADFGDGRPAGHLRGRRSLRFGPAGLAKRADAAGRNAADDRAKLAGRRVARAWLQRAGSAGGPGRFGSEKFVVGAAGDV